MLSSDLLKALFVAHKVTASTRGDAIEPDMLILSLLAVAPHAIPDELGGSAVADRMLTRAEWNPWPSRPILSGIHELPFAPGTERLLRAAAAIASSRDDDRVLPEHVLMVLLEEGSSIAVALKAEGITSEALSMALRRQISTETPRGRSAAVLVPRTGER